MQSITRDDVVTFYKRIMVPGNAALVVVGDIRAETITAAIEARLRAWAARPAAAVAAGRAAGIPAEPGRLLDR